MRLHEAQRARAAKKQETAAKKAELRAFKATLRQKAEGEGDDAMPTAEDMTQLDTLQAAVDALEAEADSMDARIAVLEQLRDDEGTSEPTPAPLEVEAAFPGNRQRGLTPHGYGEAPRKQGPGFKAARFIIGQVLAKRMGVSLDKIAPDMERVYGDKDVAKALNTAGTAAGGALIPQAFVAELIELLRPDSVVRDLDPEIIDISGGNLTLPRQNSAATASYQGELDNVQASQPGFDDVQLNAKKMHNISICV